MKFKFLFFLVLFFNINCAEQNIYYQPGEVIYIKNLSDTEIEIFFKKSYEGREFGKQEPEYLKYGNLKPNEEITIELCWLLIDEAISMVGVSNNRYINKKDCCYNPDHSYGYTFCPLKIGKTYVMTRGGYIQHYGYLYHFNIEY